MDKTKKLSSKQKKKFDKLIYQRHSLERLMKSISHFYAKSMERIISKEQKIWFEVAGEFELDIIRQKYRVEEKDGEAFVVEISDEELG